MIEFIKISDVSDALGIPASTLRFWEKKGLIQCERDGINNYRSFSFPTMVDICNIMLFKNLELPLAELKEVSTKNSDDLEILFGETKTGLKQKIKYFQQVIDQIQARERLLEEYRLLQAQPLRVVQERLQPVYFFSFNDKEMVQLYLNDQSLAVDILLANNTDFFQYGMFMESGHQKVLREGDIQRRNYLYGLLWMNKDQESNVELFRKTAKNLGYKTGSAICQYLISFNEKEHGYCHFFKTWLEIM